MMNASRCSSTRLAAALNSSEWNRLRIMATAILFSLAALALLLPRMGLRLIALLHKAFRRIRFQPGLVTLVVRQDAAVHAAHFVVHFGGHVFYHDFSVSHLVH